MDDGEFGEGDEYADQQENAEERLSGSVHGSTAAEWHEWYELQGNGSWRESSAWSWVEEERDRGGGADKILVPEFSAEGDRDGVKAQGYLRKVEAWRRVAKVKSHKQALMLYNHLSGRAWQDAEELDLGWLDGEAGVSYFIDWVRNRYLDREVISSSGEVLPCGLHGERCEGH